VKRLAAIAVLLTACRGSGESAPPLEGGPSGDDGGDDSSIDLGVLAVSTYGCSQCHQSADPEAGVLSGQATPVPGSMAYGSNLTPDPDTGMDAWEAGVIGRAILQAEDEDRNPLCPQMPAYGDAGMTAAQAESIALYLQSLPAVWHPVPRSVCPPVKGGGDGG
jgi:hypothetical protein